jgi:hypothetical protein
MWGLTQYNPVDLACSKTTWMTGKHIVWLEKQNDIFFKISRW